MSRRIALIYGPETPDGQAVVTSDYVVGVNDAVVAADASSDNPLIVTLPLAATRTLKSEVTVVKVDSTANVVSVIVQGADTISGVTTVNLTNQWDSLVVEAAGTGRWLRVQSSGGGGGGLPAGGTLNDVIQYGAGSAAEWTNSVNLVGVTADRVQFDTGATVADAVGQLRWNNTDATLNLGVNSNVNIRLGQLLIQEVMNNHGSALSVGEAVYVLGASGNRLSVAKAKADSETTASKTFGVVLEAMNNNGTGFVATYGLVRNLNTLSLTEGAAVWLSAATAGGLTSTRPAAPNHGVLIGFCVRSHAVNGELFVAVTNGHELDELHDVGFSGLLSGDVLGYDGTKWTNVQRALTTRTITAGTGLTGGGDLSADRTLAVSYGTTAGTAAQGNDSRITGAAQVANNLSDLSSVNTARSNLGVPPAGGTFVTSTNLSGLLVENMNPNTVSIGGSTTLTSGRIVLVPIYLPAGLTINNLAACSQSTAATSPTNQWFVLCNSSRTALRFTSNDTTAAWGANAVKFLPLTSAFTTTYSGLHFVGVLVTATTPPTLRSLSATAAGLTMDVYNSDTGLTTPASAPATFAASARLQTTPWVGVS